jgi:L-alanine-DL-glutamate epimerase-like enolase superfamily enzyme
VPTVDRAEIRLLTLTLSKPVGGSGVARVGVLVVELEDSDGATGLGFSYVLGGTGAVAAKGAEEILDDYVRHTPLRTPAALWRHIASSFGRSGLGPNLVALAAIDVAMWDLHARRLEVPLGVAMGGELRSVDVYGSGGFTASQSPSEAAETAAAHLACGLRAVKPRAQGMPSDAALLAGVRKAVGESVTLMVDANERCDLPAALALLAIAKDQGAMFVEEPLPASAMHGYRVLARQPTVAIAFGEHLQAISDFARPMAGGEVAIVQPDLAMIGGLTPALQIAHLAEAFDVLVAPHFLPGLFIHLAAVSPSVRWLEDFPLLEPLFEGWPKWDSSGRLRPTGAAGHGLTLAPQGS